MFRPTFGFKHSQFFQFKEQNYQFSLQSSQFLSSYIRGNSTTLYFSRSSAKSPKWSVMGASTYVWEELSVTYKCTGWVWEITSWSWRLHENYQSFKWIKQNRKMSTRNRLDLESLGSWPTMLKTSWALASKVEGAKTNTPPTTNTYKHLPITNTLLPWSVPHGVGVYGPTKWRF